MQAEARQFWFLVVYPRMYVLSILDMLLLLENTIVLLLIVNDQIIQQNMVLILQSLLEKLHDKEDILVELLLAREDYETRELDIVHSDYIGNMTTILLLLDLGYITREVVNG
jgi:hypothetical protein